MTLATQLLIGWAAMAALMALLWLVQRWTGDAGIVDVAWALGVGALAVGACALADGLPERRLLLGVLAAAWALRLGGYLLWRVLTQPEDGRYEALRERWGGQVQRKLFAFFQLQATWSVLFAAPIAVAADNPAPLGLLDALGLALWLAATAGEALADRQLDVFRRDPGSKGQVCQRGLWRYSRHPNYFFEWWHWWAYVLIGWSGPFGAWTLLGPASMYVFLVHITGIPPTEARAVKSRGEAYRAYQRTTSAFIPWPPRQDPEAQTS